MAKKLPTAKAFALVPLTKDRSLRLLAEVDYISITVRNPEDVRNLPKRDPKKICNLACYPEDLRSHCWSYKALEEMRILVTKGLLEELALDSHKLPSFRVTKRGHLYIDKNGVLPGQTS